MKKLFVKLAILVSGKTQEELAYRAFIFQFLCRNRFKSTYLAIFSK